MQPRNLIALLLFFIATAWVMTLSPHTVRNLQNAYFYCLSPFLSAGSSFEKSSHNFTAEVKHSKTLSKQLKAAEDELLELRAKVSHLEGVASEVNNLRAALQFPKHDSFAGVLANVLKRDPSTWWQTALIDRGSSHAISDYQPVLSPEGLVGKIDRVGKSDSTVLLLTDEKCQVSAKVAGTHEVGILSGQRTPAGDSPTLRLKFLSANAAVTSGMKVFTTGRGGIFPPDILLGTIEDLSSGSFAAQATVRPSVDFEKIQTVLVLTSQ